MDQGRPGNNLTMIHLWQLLFAVRAHHDHVHDPHHGGRYLSMGVNVAYNPESMLVVPIIVAKIVDVDKVGNVRRVFPLSGWVKGRTGIVGCSIRSPVVESRKL